MAQIALDFTARSGMTGSPCRFDVVVVDLEADTVRIDVFTNAFDVSPYV